MIWLGAMRALDLARYIEDLLSQGELAVAARLLAAEDRGASESRKLAHALLHSIELGHAHARFERVLAAMLDRWYDDPELVVRVARVALEHARHSPSLLEAVVRALPRTLQSLDPAEATDPHRAGVLLATFGEVSHALGPRFLPVAARAYETARSLEDRPTWRYAQALVLKDARRFEEAFNCLDSLVRGGQRAPELLWNLAVCATGAGFGEPAVEALVALGFRAQLGPDWLPEVARLPRVRVSFGARGQRRGARREIVWAAPRSPCHGVVLSATARDVGVDRGDVVLWDVVPQGRRATEVVLRGLDRIERSRLSIHRFRAREAYPGQLVGLRAALPREVELHLYETRASAAEAEVEELRSTLCVERASQRNAVVLEGKLAIEPALPLAQAHKELERAIAAAPGVVVCTPSLYRAVPGREAEAAEHAALWAELERLD